MPAFKLTLFFFAATCLADEGLRRGLTFHAPFDAGFDASLSADDPVIAVPLAVGMCAIFLLLSVLSRFYCLFLLFIS